MNTPPNEELTLTLADVSLAAIISLIGSGLWYGVFGWRVVGDAARYIDGADRLLAGLPFVEKESSYIGYVALVASVKGLGLGQGALHLLQVAIAAAACTAAADVAYAVSKESRAAAFAAASLIAFNADIGRWQHYLLTDSIYASLLVLTVWAVGRTRGNARWRPWLLATLLAGASALVRPNGWPVLLLVLLMLLDGQSRHRARLSQLTLVVACLVLTAVSTAARRGVEREHPGRWLREGIVIWGSDDWKLRMPASTVGREDDWVGTLPYVMEHPVASSRLLATRIVVELTHVRPFYSRVHNVAILMLVPLYALAVTGVVTTFSDRSTRLLTAIVLVHLLVVGLTFADWDGRFLCMQLPLVSIAAAVGLVRLRERVRLRPVRARLTPTA